MYESQQPTWKCTENLESASTISVPKLRASLTAVASPSENAGSQRTELLGGKITFDGVHSMPRRQSDDQSYSGSSQTLWVKATLLRLQLAREQCIVKRIFELLKMFLFGWTQRCKFLNTHQGHQNRTLLLDAHVYSHNTALVKVLFKLYDSESGSNINHLGKSVPLSTSLNLAFVLGGKAALCVRQ